MSLYHPYDKYLATPDPGIPGARWVDAQGRLQISMGNHMAQSQAAAMNQQASYYNNANPTALPEEPQKIRPRTPTWPATMQIVALSLLAGQVIGLLLMSHMSRPALSIAMGLTLFGWVTAFYGFLHHHEMIRETQRVRMLYYLETGDHA